MFLYQISAPVTSSSLSEKKRSVHVPSEDEGGNVLLYQNSNIMTKVNRERTVLMHHIDVKLQETDQIARMITHQTYHV